MAFPSKGPQRSSAQPRVTMSMEAALEEERREVEALVAARNAMPAPPTALGGVRSSSPYTPRSPVRSMLDIGPVRPVSQAPVRSMLDMDTPLPSKSGTKQVFSTPSSPVLQSNQLARASNSSHPRHMSDVSTQPVGFGPRSSDLTSRYQFGDIYTNTGGQQMPKRVFQKNKKDQQGPSSMSHIVRGNDIPTIPTLPGDRGRHSIAGPSIRPGSKSRSPHSRLGAGTRSQSPGNSIIQARALSPAGRAVYQEAHGEWDMSNAYRKLSDLNRLRAGGLLANSVGRKRAEDQPGGGRLAKDYLSPDGDVLLDDSSDEQGFSSQEEGERGRKAARDSENTRSTKPVKSLLAAAEEERIQVAKGAPQQQYRSLLEDPEITVTAPSGETLKQQSKAKGIHPSTAFDDGPPSGTRTPMGSDDEADLVDIRRAQKLAFTQTAIINTPNAARAVRIIYRGDYAQVTQEAKEEQRQLRKYVVATDLSDESTHALEWTVGTVLRDGDTLICLYCVDEEIGIAPRDGSQIPDERKAMREQGAVLNMMTSSKAPVTPGGSTVDLQRSSFVGQSPKSESSPGPARSKAQEERHMAAQDITERVKRFLRKTRLQVRVIVEVLHCKNPKHQILEIIDVVSPTLVILGSRGQSALKGVILGSFSNYLVTKSSVPVMVARKRLRKQSKYKRLALTQVNNISNPTARSLANAKID